MAIVLIACGALAIPLLVVGAIVLSGGLNEPAGPEGGRAAAPSVVQGTSGPTSGVSLDAGKARFEIVWNESERHGGAVFIDGVKTTVPSSGPITFELAAGSHDVMMVRRGFEPLQIDLSLAAKESRQYTPQWQQSDQWEYQPPPTEVVMPSPTIEPRPVVDHHLTFDDWLQDYEAARARAAQEDKDVLVVFSGSDWCGYCRQMAKDTFLQPEFRDVIEPRYVLVYVDIPRSPAAQRKVEDFGRNQQLARHFQVGGFPTVLVTNSDGQTIGTVRGYIPGGVSAFVGQLDRGVARTN